MLDGSQQTAIADVASKATYFGAGTSSVSWLFSSEVAVAAGVLMGFIGLLVIRKHFHLDKAKEVQA